MLSNIWRFLLALFDLRALARLLTGQPALDVVFVTNLRDEAERRRFFGGWAPPEGHADGPRVYLHGVAGRVRGIYVTAEEMLTREGRRKARQQFIAATEWAEQRGARVVLLAASTKRLFGRDGAELKRRFPHLLFTIGDNGTAQMLRADVFRALAHACLRPGEARVMVIGPYGILGERMTRELVKAGYEVVGYGTNAAALTETAEKHGIQVRTDIDAVGKVDAVVACTHSAAAKLTHLCVARLRRANRKLLVVDVAEPANLEQEVYQRCEDVVVRQDAGNAYSRGLRYVLGPLSWRKLMLSRGVVFGCFAEALTLYHAIYHRAQLNLAAEDWFVVDDAHMELVRAAFDEVGFTAPTPRCFGKAVRGFSLRLSGWAGQSRQAALSPLPLGVRLGSVDVRKNEPSKQ
jgi:predicted amino acid dehydrogenase